MVRDSGVVMNNRCCHVRWGLLFECVRALLFSVGLMTCAIVHAEDVRIELVALGGLYYLEDEPRATIELRAGRTYVFEGYTGWHPLGISLTPDGRWQGGVNYEQGVTTTDTSLRIEVSEETPDLHYFCEHHPGMGGAIVILKGQD